MTLPTASYFLADCRLSANCLPTGLCQTPQEYRLFYQNPVGKCQLLLPTCQLAEKQEQQGFYAVGKSADFPLLLRSNADARPLKGRSDQLPINNQRKD